VKAGSYRESWLLAYPAIITMISETVMWTVDAAMVGHIGKSELAAVGLGGLLVWTIASFFVGLSHSVSTFVAQSYGARRLPECATFLWNGLYIGIFSGACVLALKALNPWTVDILGPAPQVRDLCVLYAGIRMLGTPFFILQYTYANFFRALGNTVTPMKVAILANLINVVLDYALIFGVGPFPALGVAGAAWATVAANIVSLGIFAAISFLPLYRREFHTDRRRRPDADALVRLLKVGAPIGVHYFLDIGSFLVFSAYVGRMGTEQLAANQIVIQVLALSFMPCHGFVVAATTLMGQYIGAGRPDLAKKSAYTTLKLGLVYAGVVGAVYVAVPGLLVRVFNDDPLVLSYGKRLIYLAAAFQVFDATQMITSGALRGAGDTRFPMILALGGGWLVFLPAAYLFGTVLAGGVVGAWVGATLYVLVLAGAVLLRLKTDRWKRIRIALPSADAALRPR
jgi:MATE family multidrug resistance protein